MPRYKITIAYDGTDFHGWQKQQSTKATGVEGNVATPAHSSLDVEGAGSEPLRTVQHVVELAVRAVVREPVNVLGASRTDAGVHARGQVAAFTTTCEIPVEKLPRAITSRLPDDVQIINAEVVADDFDPIRSAQAKCYRYCIAHSCARHRRPLFSRDFVTHTAYRLDPVRMNEAARRLLGEHDWSSFTRIAHGRDSTVRTVFDCKVTATHRHRCELEIVGNGFLYNMVRIIAGTLIEVGRGAVEPEHMAQIIAARDRRAAGPTLPPNGLCLMWIRYALRAT